MVMFLLMIALFFAVMIDTAETETLIEIEEFSRVLDEALEVSTICKAELKHALKPIHV